MVGRLLISLRLYCAAAIDRSVSFASAGIGRLCLDLRPKMLGIRWRSKTAAKPGRDPLSPTRVGEKSYSQGIATLSDEQASIAEFIPTHE